MDMTDNIVQPEYVVMAPTSSCVPDLQNLMTVNGSSLHLNPEEEYARYGFLEKDREEAIRFIGDTHGWSPVYDICNRRLPPESDYVWNGWQTAYLLMKRDANGAEVSDFQYVQSIDKIISRKRKYETLACEGMQEISGHMMHVKGEIVLSLAFAALLAYKDWLELESVVGEIECDAVQKNMFDCFAKFVLSILDEEDMERMFFSEQIRFESEEFFYKICAKGLFRDFVRGKLESDQFCHMTEGDFYQTFRAARSRKVNLLITIPGIPEEVKLPEVPDMYRLRALQLVKEHRPLKREFRAQVLMEHSCIKGFHVTDILILEAMHSLSLPELSEKYAARLSAEDAAKLSRLLGDLAGTMFQMAHKVSVMKAQQALATECAVLRPVISMFCRFMPEVEDVLRIANYERRMENERFITLSHILTGLRCTRVSACVPENLSGVAAVVTSSKLSVYKLCELTRDVMSYLGDFLAGLDHIVLTICYGSLRGLRHSIVEGPHSKFIERLEACRQTGPERKLKSVDVFTTILERRCRAKHVLKLNGSELILKLDKDLKSGRIVLPKDDDLRV